MVARPSLVACSVFCSEETLLFHAGVLFRNGVVGSDDRGEVLQRWQGRAQPGQCGECGLRGHIADEDVLREGASAESTDCRVEAAAAGAVGGGDLRCGFVRTRVEVHAEVYRLTELVVGDDGGDDLFYELRGCEPDRVG